MDTPLLRGALNAIAREGRRFGYGVRTGSINAWDGQGDAFSQFNSSIMIEDHGRVDDLEAYFCDKRYRHVVLGMRFNTLFRIMGEIGVAPMNVHIDKIRQRPV
ncbi:MAG TPA: hypothetical protein G4O00_12460 [Thermoflexia bacterium]|nr:hypothetical protein [Thermoflexia bacterium]